MRSIPAKAILTLLVTALFVGSICWAASIPWMSHPDSTTMPTSSSVHTHLFSPKWFFDDTIHWNVCACGQQTNTAPHLDEDFDEECDICAAPVPHEHSFGSAWESDDTNHWNICPCGQQANTAPHLDGDFDEECDICAAPFPHEHSFGSVWESDDSNHWNECACGEQTNIAPHADEDFDESCDICAAHVPHEHSFGSSWESDDTNHWNACPCGQKNNLAPHADEDLDEKCDICAAPVPHEHSFGSAWESNENGHWQMCHCGGSSDPVAHADQNGDHRCDVCRYIVSYPDPPTLNGSSAFIYTCDEDRFLFHNQALNHAIYPASVTKLFTAYVALQYLNITDIVVLGDEQSFFPYDASKAGLDPGDIVTVETLLHGLLMKSGSDCAYGLAAAAGRRIRGDENVSADLAVAAFITKMNQTAKSLGMENTHFVRPDGIHDDNHYISLGAFVIIAKCAMENETILEICGKHKATVYYTGASGRDLYITFTSTNALINPDSDYYIPEAVGLKTGYTDPAGNCFLGLFYHDGKYVVIGTFGCTGSSARWRDIQRLWEYYLEIIAI